MRLQAFTAPNIRVPHAFLGRQAGVSPEPFASLNLGLSSGDSAENVAANRARALEFFGSSQATVCAFHQIHSARVLDASPSWFTEEADAAVTDNPALTLIVSVADCLPILFYDTEAQVIGAAHCGWRGTSQRIASATVRKMVEDYGAKVENIQIAMGMGIRQLHYQVGAEVIDAFSSAGFPEHIAYADDTTDDKVDEAGRFRLDVAGANRWELLELGIPENNIWDSGLCTFSDPVNFFSYRRDQGTTGRHWAMIKLG